MAREPQCLGGAPTFGALLCWYRRGRKPCSIARVDLSASNIGPTVEGRKLVGIGGIATSAYREHIDGAGALSSPSTWRAGCFH